jgi:hypothetical protein
MVWAIKNALTTLSTAITIISISPFANAQKNAVKFAKYESGY